LRAEKGGKTAKIEKKSAPLQVVKRKIFIEMVNTHHIQNFSAELISDEYFSISQSKERALCHHEKQCNHLFVKNMKSANREGKPVVKCSNK
jgi:hypothetical protein